MFACNQMHFTPSKKVHSLRVASFVVFLSLFRKESGLFLASSLWFLFTVSPLLYRFVVTQEAQRGEGDQPSH